MTSQIDLPSRAAIVATARESIVRGSKSFFAASLLFDRRTRDWAWLLYSWCRRCDDLADGQDHGHDLSAVPDPAERLAQIRAMTDMALAGETVGEPAFDALRIVAAETRMPHRFAHDLIEVRRVQTNLLPFDAVIVATEDNCLAVAIENAPFGVIFCRECVPG